MNEVTYYMKEEIKGSFFQPLFLEWGTVALLLLDREPSFLFADTCVLALSVLVPCDWLGLLAANR